MSRLTHKLVIFISSLFSPGFNASVTSSLNGLFHTIPRGLPLTVTSARFLTTPRSSQSCLPFSNQFSGALIVFIYVPVPEKYFTPGSGFSLHDARLSRVIFDGAPRSGWKLTSQAPEIVSSGFSVVSGKARDFAFVVLRNTTNNASFGSRSKDNFVRPFLITY